MASRAAACVLAAAFVVAAVAAGRIAWLVWRPAPTARDALLARERLLPGDVAANRALAGYDLGYGRAEAARVRLAAAVEQAPFDAGLWLDRAQAALQAGRLDEARDAARAAVARAPVDGTGCYAAALVLLQADDAPGAAPFLRCVAERTERTREVLDLGHAVYGDPAVVLRDVLPPGPAQVRQFFEWAQDRDLPEAAALAWAGLARAGPTDADVARRVNFLVARGEVDEAEVLWTGAHGPRDATGVFNGDFERPLSPGGFGWRLESGEGFRVRVAGGSAAARGGRGLAIEFLGGNLHFHHVMQVVPVRGDRRYRLSALVRAEGITSLSGPRFLVQPTAACRGLASANGDEVRGNTGWTATSIEFATPPGCRAVFVLVHRVPTERFDQDLRGRLFVDDVRLRDLGAAADESGATPG